VESHNWLAVDEIKFRKRGDPKEVLINALKVREDLDKLLDIGFIYPIETTQRLSPLVIVPKKNGKLQICVHYCKLNVQTKKDPFPLPFLDSILYSVVEHDMYSFMDGYSGYN
jgi:hypothetical protein